MEYVEKKNGHKLNYNSETGTIDEQLTDPDTKQHIELHFYYGSGQPEDEILKKELKYKFLRIFGRETFEQRFGIVF